MPSAIEPLPFSLQDHGQGVHARAPNINVGTGIAFAIDIHNGMGCEVRWMYSTDLDPVNLPTDLIFPRWRRELFKAILDEQNLRFDRDGRPVPPNVCGIRTSADA
jgi:hypothetical protein